MPNQPRTPKQNMRIPTDRWKAFANSAAKMATDRTKIVNQFIAWYNREPGAELPHRPPASPTSGDTGQSG
ncbi:hypothetical protein [Sphaerisporangium sp. TRM90804]|uniref:hypothetical protein n=1 Tax=Sphaerisporangium sp. TRM90804 TaxID=3031113 RepID=UPI002449C3C4|nr:hypothetical protein [Sphaerisporangium sp. TRM90804]MDH2425812.1 hypothetical protein [Sphaerisporangium sp. TRM90804]